METKTCENDRRETWKVADQIKVGIFLDRP